jgi:hypothetical protein
MSHVPSETDRDFFAANGYFIARGLVSPREATEIRDSCMDLVAHKEACQDFFDLTKGLSPTDGWSIYPRAMQPHRLTAHPAGPLAKHWLIEPRFQAYIEGFLEEPALAAQSMFYYKPPGARGQDLHQDNFYLRVAPRTCMAAWLALDTCDRANGGLKVVPGPHKFGIICPEQADLSRYTSPEHIDVPPGHEAIDACMDPSDVLFFNGSVIHGSEPNTTTDRFRRSFICHYLPTSAKKIGSWYKPLVSFTGAQADRTYVEEGGPCGTIQDQLTAAGRH